MCTIARGKYNLSKLLIKMPKVTYYINYNYYDKKSKAHFVM